jgi:sialate O-acetylesterase
MRTRTHLPLPALLGFALFSLIATLVGAATEERPFLSPAFGDFMVLQRGKPNTIWGWTKPGEKVRVSVAEKSAEGTAGADGKWTVTLEPPAAGGPYEVQVTGSQNRILKEVLVGDVWLCSGQSNMEFGLPRSRDGEKEVKAALHPDIRLFRVPTRSGYSPKMVVEGSWKVCTPDNVSERGGFSAVAYYFALKLQSETHVPIGLIQAAVGGSPVESWTSAEKLRSIHEFGRELDEIERLRAKGVEEYGNYIMHWYDEYDAGIRGTAWFEPSFDDSKWKSVTIPGAFAELGVAEVPAVCWFRREIELPDPLPEGQATVFLGVVEKMDTVYINGHWVGASSWVENPRRYNVPAGVLKPGKNLITLRILKVKTPGAFLSTPETLQLKVGAQQYPLAGSWKAAVSVDARPPHALPLGYENYPTMPAVLFNGMIAPVAPLAITGALWYQGEANFTRAYQYRKLLPAMISDWRSTFKQGDFPVYIVGLPAFMARKDEPTEDGWTELREAQALTAATVPNTGLAVVVDTGDAEDIHPKEKKIVGDRLALLALANTYGKSVVASGPTFQSMDKADGKLVIHFSNTSGGLTTKGEKLGEFTVAGADRKFHHAQAEIRGNDVVVSSPEVKDPVAVRYAWQANPLATLYNGAGLPAVPFRSDDWPGVTQPKETK